MEGWGQHCPLAVSQTQAPGSSLRDLDKVHGEGVCLGCCPSTGVHSTPGPVASLGLLKERAVPQEAAPAVQDPRLLSPPPAPSFLFLQSAGG